MNKLTHLDDQGAARMADVGEKKPQRRIARAAGTIRLLSATCEQIRAQFGANNPRARLSRAIADVAGTTQIHTLPGSVRAVEEYLPEILSTLDHLAYMFHGLDPH